MPPNGASTVDERRMVGCITHGEQSYQQRLAAAEQALLEARAALSARNQLLAIAAHELRTPLTALKGYVYMLRHSVEARSALAAINRQAERLNELIEQLFDLAQLDHASVGLSSHSLDLVALVEHVVDDVRIALVATHAAHRIEVARPDGALLVRGDPHRLEQVAHNLLSNAVKYSPDGGVVHVRLERHAQEGVIEVSDQGIGIPAHEQAQLFTPFCRGTNVPLGTEGLGIGLYVVSELVQRHGGLVEVRSTEGEGSTFRVAIPLDQRAG